MDIVQCVIYPPLRLGEVNPRFVSFFMADVPPMSSTNPYKVFHSLSDALREKVHVALVRPELGANVGAVCRGMANMGIRGKLIIVGSPQIVDSQCLRLAKHARDKALNASHYSQLEEALKDFGASSKLVIGATARVGSAHRPHPIRARQAATSAVEQLAGKHIDHLLLVFGPESDGLDNDDIRQCDWVATIPSSEDYRSLNLGQSVLLFCYEVHMNLLKDWAPFQARKKSEKQRLSLHLQKMAEKVGFVLPGDPFKMKPKLDKIFSHLPSHIDDVQTLHGLIDQVIRTVEKGKVEYKGRFRHYMESHNADHHPER